MPKPDVNPPFSVPVDNYKALLSLAFPQTMTIPKIITLTA